MRSCSRCLFEGVRLSGEVVGQNREKEKKSSREQNEHFVNEYVAQHSAARQINIANWYQTVGEEGSQFRYITVVSSFSRLLLGVLSTRSKHLRTHVGRIPTASASSETSSLVPSAFPTTSPCLRTLRHLPRSGKVKERREKVDNALMRSFFKCTVGSMSFLWLILSNASSFRSSPQMVFVRSLGRGRPVFAGLEESVEW